MKQTADWGALQSKIQSLVEQEGLPAEYSTTVSDYFIPLAERIAAVYGAVERPVLIGVNGAQGTGKSTLAAFLQLLLSEGLGLPCVKFSLDDIYLTKRERQRLAESVHPLFATRGVPGTHDIALGQQTVDDLCSAVTKVAIPAFDKAVDDRAPQSRWPQFQAPACVVIVEGWCMAAKPELDKAALMRPCNSLEQEEDPQGQWRTYVNQRLKGEYADFFERLDYLIMLKAPSMECVVEWRTLQEIKLLGKIVGHQNGADDEAEVDFGVLDMPKNAQTKGIMNQQQIQRFVMHYERLTRAMLAEMPGRADALLAINEKHQITQVTYHEP